MGFKSRTFESNGSVVKLHIWDEAVPERYKSVIQAYYNGAHGIVLVYDIADRQSFYNIEDWLAEAN